MVGIQLKISFVRTSVSVQQSNHEYLFTKCSIFSFILQSRGVLERNPLVGYFFKNLTVF